MPRIVVSWMDGTMHSEELTVIGVDCATAARNVGLSRIVVQAGAVADVEVAAGAGWPEIEATVIDWLAARCVVALDAPLGWPRAMATELRAHHAGARLQASAHEMFRRATDDFVARELGKRPLDVGADRIARTAHAALGFLDRLRTSSGRVIPLGWTPGVVDDAVAIEVYPAATLAARALPSRGYKRDDAGAVAVRERIANELQQQVSLSARGMAAVIASDHMLDALLCAVSGLDFARGEVLAPEDTELARDEGWIWVKRRAR